MMVQASVMCCKWPAGWNLTKITSTLNQTLIKWGAPSPWAAPWMTMLQASENVIVNLGPNGNMRSEEHTSELQSRFDLVCRLLLEKKKKKKRKETRTGTKMTGKRT